MSSTFAASSGDCGVLYSEGDGVQEIAEKDISFNLQANVPDTVNVEIFFAYGSGQGPLTYRVLGTSFYPLAPRTTTTTTTSVTTTTATTTTIAAYPLYEEMDFGGCPWNRDRNAVTLFVIEVIALTPPSSWDFGLIPSTLCPKLRKELCTAVT